MRKQFKLALWKLIAKGGEGGFSLPLVLSFGMIMVLSGVTMLTRAESSLNDSFGQQKIGKEALLLEGVVDRALSLLNESGRALSTDKNNDGKVDKLDWAIIYPPNSPQTVKELFDEAFKPIKLEDTSIDYSYFYLYDKDKKVGNFSIDVIQTNIQNKKKKSETVSIKIPVKPADLTDDISLYSLVAEKVYLGDNNVIGSIACTKPTAEKGQPCSLSSDDPSKNLTYKQQRESIKASNESIIKSPISTAPYIKDAEIAIGTMAIPSVPPSPPIDQINVLNPLAQDPLKPQPPKYLPLTKADLQLPRIDPKTKIVTDKDPDGDGVYYYSITAEGMKDSNISVKNGTKAIIYVEGKLEMGKDNSIAAYAPNINGPIIPSPGQIKIYGSNTNSQEFIINGDACVMAFILAPKADIKINSSGEGQTCEKIFNNSRRTRRDAPEFSAQNYPPQLWERLKAYEKAINSNASSDNDDDDDTTRYPNIYGAVWVNSYEGGNKASFWEQIGLMESLWRTERAFFNSLVPPKIQLQRTSNVTQK